MASQPRRFHAVVIGIDKYPSPSIGRLAGAVADAKAMEGYLITRIGVSKSQIVVLHDHNATRTAILNALEAIEINPLIREDDPILIYFAGHGDTAASPPGWNSTGSKIQLILPYDCDLKVGSDIVSGIPDQTIAALLNKIAKAKGDNITVIFDCCHSGSGTRDPKRLIRCGKGTGVIPAELDQDIWGTSSSGRKALIPGGFLRKGMRSHVLLAACGAEEPAAEQNNRGVFTTALIEKLEATGAKQVTYAELIRQIGSLDKGRQNPQCEGENRGHLLFNAKTDNSQIRSYGVEKVDGQYKLTAGTMHGIFEGSRFEIYDQDSSESSISMPVGVLTASKPGTVTTVLNLPDNYPAFEIYVEGKELQNMLQYCIEELEMKISQRVNDSNTILGITLEKGHLIFKILEEHMTSRGLDRIPLSIPFSSPPSHDALEHFKRVILSAVHYYHHLRQGFPSQSLTGEINVEFTQLEGEEDAVDGLQPVGPNLIKNDEIDVVEDEKANYGLKLTNSSRTGVIASENVLMAHIVCFYRSGISGGKADASLPPGETLIVGSGAAGGDPISFGLDPEDGYYAEGFNRTHLDIDIGLFKIYLSTTPVDIEDLQQASPFVPIDPKKNRIAKKRKDYRFLGDTKELWKIIKIPLIERRRPMSAKTFNGTSSLIDNEIGSSNGVGPLINNEIGVSNGASSLLDNEIGVSNGASLLSDNEIGTPNEASSPIDNKIGTSDGASSLIDNNIGISAFLLLAGSYIAYKAYPYLM